MSEDLRASAGVSSKTDYYAFTRLDLVCVLAVLTVLILVALPLLANTSFRSNQTSCLNNLRQIGIAFQAWGNDHNDRRPWLVPIKEGGSAGHIQGVEPWFQFAFLSNHISPGVLMDPAETGRNKRRAENWNFTPYGGFLHNAFRNNALSYMLGAHATIAEANEILAADRHVQFNGIGGCIYFSTVFRLGSFQFRGWTNGPHGFAGNLLINDGHVEFASQQGLQSVLRPIGDAGGEAHILTPPQ